MRGVGEPLGHRGVDARDVDLELDREAESALTVGSDADARTDRRPVDGDLLRAGDMAGLTARAREFVDAIEAWEARREA